MKKLIPLIFVVGFSGYMVRIRLCGGETSDIEIGAYEHPQISRR